MSVYKEDGRAAQGYRASARLGRPAHSRRSDQIVANAWHDYADDDETCEASP
jgi:hypothetical protein